MEALDEESDGDVVVPPVLLEFEPAAEVELSVEPVAPGVVVLFAPVELSVEPVEPEVAPLELSVEPLVEPLVELSVEPLVEPPVAPLVELSVEPLVVPVEEPELSVEPGVVVVLLLSLGLVVVLESVLDEPELVVPGVVVPVASLAPVAGGVVLLESVDCCA